MKLRLVCGVALLLLAGFAGNVEAACNMRVLEHEKRDDSTILTLERTWNLAYLTGDTRLLGCLLTPDFTEIMRNGAVYRRVDELELAEKNRGRKVPVPRLPKLTILMHGNVAVAYGLASERRIRGVLYESYYADYYFWAQNSWRAFFAQWTQAQVPTA